MLRRLTALVFTAVAVLTVSAAAGSAGGTGKGDGHTLSTIQHIVVIY